LKAIAQKARKTADKEREQNTASENMSEILENILNKTGKVPLKRSPDRPTC